MDEKLTLLLKQFEEGLIDGDELVEKYAEEQALAGKTEESARTLLLGKALIRAFDRYVAY